MSDQHDSSEKIRAAFENIKNIIERAYEMTNCLDIYMSQEHKINSYFDMIKTEVSVLFISCKTATAKAQAEIEEITAKILLQSDEIKRQDEIVIKRNSRIKELEQAAITKAETYQSALDEIHKELECCGNCKMPITQVCDYQNVKNVCDNWKQKKST